MKKLAGEREKSRMSGQLVKALSELNERRALEVVENRLEANENPVGILDDARQAMELVGKRFAAGDYFLPELVYSGVILKRITDMVKPRIAVSAERKRIGKCIIGTVAGDVHDVGKDIVVFMLDVNGFEVHDLGIDVPSAEFIGKIMETGASIVGLSGFLTLAFDAMKDTVEAIKEAGLRRDVKIMIGGGQIDDTILRYTGADAYGKDAMAAVFLAKEWSGVD